MRRYRRRILAMGSALRACNGFREHHVPFGELAVHFLENSGVRLDWFRAGL